MLITGRTGFYEDYHVKAHLVLGKGTQAKKIAAKYQIPHISTGDIFRANIKNGTELGMKAKSYIWMQAVLCRMKLPSVCCWTASMRRTAKTDMYWTGFPRTIPQAREPTKALGDMGEAIDYAINVDVRMRTS